jgi:NitT/TauT family transport system permease protein
MVLPIIYTNVLEGLKNTDKKLLEAAAVYKMPWAKRFKYIHLPALRPHIISACSLALGLAWKSGIAAEIIGIPEGSVGEMFYYAKAYLNSLDLFAWTLTVVAVSVVFEKAFTMLIKLFYKRLFKPSAERS